MLTPILITIAAIIVLFVIIVATRPGEFRITRTAAMAAPATTVFAQVNDFHKWNAWSPWAKMDPACRNTYDGADAGVGAGFAWDGNKKVGAGSMRILESRPNDFIRIRIEFLKPFKAVNTVEFIFQAQDAQTLVTWSMIGQKNFMSKAVGLFMDCDKMVGDDFEKGLAAMKLLAEAHKN
jgi:hypothetical protein